MNKLWSRLAFFLLLISTLSLAGFIELPYNQEKQLAFNGLKQVVILDHPENIQVSFKANILFVKGVRCGNSSILVITETGKYGFKVKVAQKELATSSQSNVDYSGKKLYSNISLGYGDGNSLSNYSQNVWNYNYMYYKLSSAGETPFGFVKNDIYIKNRQDSQGLYYFATSLKNSLGNFTVGDQLYTDISPMVFPNQPLQGFSYQNVINKFDIFSFYGNNNYGMWGKAIEREVRTDQNFYFARVNYNLAKNSIVAYNISSQAMSLLYQTIFNSYNLAAEYGLDKNSKTAKDASLAFNNGLDIRTKLNYKEYADDYAVPVGYQNFSGFKGINYNLNYQPKEFLSLDYNGDNYKRSIASKEFATYHNNVALSVYGDKYQDFLPDLVVSYWNQHDESAIIPYEAVSVVTSNPYSSGVTPTYVVTTTSMLNNYQYTIAGMQYKLKKHIPLLLNSDVWYTYSPISYENASNTSANYKKNSSLFGARLPVLGIFSLQAEYISDTFEMTNTSNYKENTLRTFYMLNPIPLYEQKLFLNAFYQYDFRFNDVLNESYRKTFYKVELVYSPNPDGKVIAAYYKTIDDNPDRYQSSRILNETRLEYSQNFNFAFNVGKKKHTLTGMIYIDENANSSLDDSEKGLSDIAVKLSNGSITTTNKWGIYKFEGVPEGESSIELLEGAQKILPSEEYPKYFSIGQDERVVVNMGVMLSNKIYGYVFVDENSDGVKDDIEKVYKGVRVMIGSDVIKTDESGYFEYITADDNKEYLVQIDYSSIPENHKLKGERKVQVSGSGKVDFVLEKVEKAVNQNDEYLEIIDKKDIGAQKVMLSATLLKPVLDVVVNDQKVNIEKGVFRAVLPKNGKKMKVKIFKIDKTYLIKYYNY